MPRFRDIPIPTFNRVAQISHTLGGLVLVAYTALIFNIKALWISVPIFTLVTAWKEFYWDEHFESPEERGSNLVDFLFYCLGQILGLLVLLAKHYL